MSESAENVIVAMAGAGMETRLAAAIWNNVALCDAVCESQGIPTCVESGLWRTLTPAPPYYPDLITIHRAVGSEQAGTLLADTGGRSVKDSFAALDLTPFGFNLLFSANWIWRDNALPNRPLAMTWGTVESRGDFEFWRSLHGSADSIPAELLVDPGISMFLGRDDGGHRAGFIANQSGDVVGISNLFATGIDAELIWRDVAALLAARYPGRDAVGYELGGDLAAARDAGFDEIGPLTVWLRSG
jgi:hypothetical protein